VSQANPVQLGVDPNNLANAIAAFGLLGVQARFVAAFSRSVLFEIDRQAWDKLGWRERELLASF
jgi:hypothetical protein